MKEEVIRYHAARLEDSVVVRDTLKLCFSCNQGDLYDENGRHLEHRFYRGNGQETYGREVFTYDDRGQKTGSSYFEGDSLTTRYEYELDDDGRVLTGRAIDPDSGEMLYGYRYAYNDQGIAYETASLDASGEAYEYYRRTYNPQGIAVSEDILDLEGTPTFRVRYQYRPQADSSWTEQVVYYNDEPSEVRVRERTYHDQSAR